MGRGRGARSPAAARTGPRWSWRATASRRACTRVAVAMNELLGTLAPAARRGRRRSRSRRRSFPNRSTETSRTLSRWPGRCEAGRDRYVVGRGRQPGLRGARRSRARARSRRVPRQHLRRALRERDRASQPLVRARCARARVLGRRARLRRHAVPGAAVDPAAARRPLARSSSSPRSPAIGSPTAACWCRTRGHEGAVRRLGGALSGGFVGTPAELRGARAVDPSGVESGPQRVAAAPPSVGGRRHR